MSFGMVGHGRTLQVVRDACGGDLPLPSACYSRTRWGKCVGNRSPHLSILLMQMLRRAPKVHLLQEGVGQKTKPLSPCKSMPCKSRQMVCLSSTSLNSEKLTWRERRTEPQSEVAQKDGRNDKWVSGGGSS